MQTAQTSRLCFVCIKIVFCLGFFLPAEALTQAGTLCFVFPMCSASGFLLPTVRALDGERPRSRWRLARQAEAWFQAQSPKTR